MTGVPAPRAYLPAVLRTADHRRHGLQTDAVLAQVGDAQTVDDTRPGHRTDDDDVGQRSDGSNLMRVRLLCTLTDAQPVPRPYHEAQPWLKW